MTDEHLSSKSQNKHLFCINTFALVQGGKMAFGQQKRAVGTFPSRQEAQEALNALRDSGFSMDKVVG